MHDRGLTLRLVQQTGARHMPHKAQSSRGKRELRGYFVSLPETGIPVLLVGVSPWGAALAVRVGDNHVYSSRLAGCRNGGVDIGASRRRYSCQSWFEP